MIRFSTLYIKQELGGDLIGAEIGVFVGVNAIDLLDSLDIKKLYLVDPYQEYTDTDGLHSQLAMDEAMRVATDTLPKYGDRVEMLINTSGEAAKILKDVPFDFVYIDACHLHPHIDNDIAAWYPLVKNGGVLAGHDYDIQDVHEAVDRFIVKERLNGSKIFFGNDWVLCK